jgi:hypothetical protein
MRSLLIASTLALSLATPAFAHDHDWPLAEELTIDQAIEIARAEGFDLIREVQFDDGRWEIEGRNAEGQTIEIEIDGVSGEIVSR